MTNMRAVVVRIGILTSVVAPLLGCDVLLALFEAPPPPGPAFVLLLPEQNSGWTCVDFGVEGAPTLPREGDTWVIDATADSGIRTSSNPSGLLSLFPRHVFQLVNGQRLPLAPGIDMRRASSNIDSKSPIARHCVFYGTERAAQTAEAPPELVRPDDSSCPAETSATVKQ